MSIQSIRSQLAAPTYFPLLGTVVAWNIGQIAISRPELIQKVTDAGLDERHVPKAIRTRSCLLRTLNDLVAEGFLRCIVEEPDRAVFVMVSEAVDVQRLDVQFKIETTITYHKDLKQVTCDDPGTQARVDQLMEHYATAFMPSDVRRFVLDVIKAAGALTLRDRGGVYFVPAPKIEVVRALDAFIQALGPSCSLMALNVPETPDDVGHVFRAFESEIIGELDELAREVATLEGDGDRVRPSTWLKRMQVFQAKREKAAMFADLLSVEADRFVNRIVDLEARVRTNLIG